MERKKDTFPRTKREVLSDRVLRLFKVRNRVVRYSLVVLSS